MTRPRVVIAGLGDTGLLTAIHLSRHADVVGVSSKPELLSGQELGLRVSRPQVWARDHRIPFGRFRKLDGVRTIHGSVSAVDLGNRTVTVVDTGGAEMVERFDALVISTGVRNGFWRHPDVQSAAEIDAELRSVHRRFDSAGSIAVIGGGAAAVSAAANLAATWPDKRVDLYHPGDRALPRHHPRTWQNVHARLTRLGVGVHAGHRAAVPAGFACDEVTTGPVRWTTGQDTVEADAVLWAIGRVVPNTAWLPADLLDESGFIRVTPELRVPGHDLVYAIGDVAATDDLRSSARNRADRILAHNIRADLSGRSGRARRFAPPKRRWGSVLGAQPDGLQVFAANGRPFRFPAWTIDTILQPWIVRRGIYGGIRGKDTD
ncbi:pyridine nucleotide-disulfide oxidoreductase [Gordonia jinghuaiqii]|uniref:FAD-dependent oxidoreductase n=1 Tax=Gordonia jinghuaiqii TaxID=2758710 RepID=A0A7D7QXP8_9ACTN|nr:FAD-dependent oxidoreductase [Gordonia jinghuaiqii]MCR5976624.1 pyridine nucleotide-disulfide oxidoreductase [Gordonia jinghuaiqii]QMS99810.1 FAD-dependent oxidoreductase [Gordonia jinghuaiqii]